MTIKKTESGNVVAQEMAESEFGRFCDAMEFDVDENEMDEKELSDFNKIKRRLIKNICKGSLVINDDGKAAYTPQKLSLDDALIFNQKNGAALTAVDGKKNNADMKKTFAVMAALAKVHPSVFSKMEGNDLNVCMGLYQLLMD